jgi:transcriptional regulator with XRE-family HTH domain
MTGPELRRALAACSLSQRAFAVLMGVDHGTVSRWCRDALAVPTYVESFLRLYAERETRPWKPRKSSARAAASGTNGRSAKRTVR